jgi:hypothetical protein
MMRNASLNILIVRPFSRGVNADLMRAVRRSTSDLSRWLSCVKVWEGYIVEIYDAA